MSKIAVVTGGTKGIGRAIIEKFAENGFDIITCARNESDLQVLKESVEKAFDIKVLVRATDMSDTKEVKEFAKFITDDHAEIDVLVNNAGSFIPGLLHSEEDGALENMINTNLYSAYHMTRGVVEGMKAQKKGHIFNICSTASFMPYENGGSYCVSKFAMLGMSKVLREEMKEYNVRVTSIMPGATFTASWEGAEIPEERFMKAEDVALATWNAYEMSDRTVIEELVMRPQLGDL